LGILQRAGSGNQIEALKYEADLPVAKLGQEIRFCRRHIQTIQLISTTRGLVEAAENIHQGRLARSGCTHDRHKFTAIDGEVDAAQCLHLNVADTINLPEVFANNQRSHAVLRSGWNGTAPGLNPKSRQCRRQ
jgi:hypothetical protein